MSNITKTAMITVCGRPNVGKSSLTNALVGEKIAIVSNKPQTTRNRIYGVVNRGDTQYVLLDTPGLHKPRSRLGDYMVKVARDGLAGGVGAGLADLKCPDTLVRECVEGELAELSLREGLGCCGHSQYFARTECDHVACGEGEWRGGVAQQYRVGVVGDVVGRVVEFGIQ